MMRIAAVVPFLNEEEHIGIMLASVAGQRRPPDLLVLVDDGSSDRSPEIAESFAREHPYAIVLHRPERPPERDRMAGVRAPEYVAFEWGLEQVLDRPWDVVAKLDADLDLTSEFFAAIDRAFEADPRVGMAGAYVSALQDDGVRRRQRCPEGHVEGPTKFYRRECLEEIFPLPPMHGWDTIDELRARMRGWRTVSIEIPSGDPLHMRRMGSHDGVMRGFRRAGLAAYVYGAHPLHVVLGGINRMREQPYAACGLNYLAGWAAAALRRQPRAEPEVRSFVRAENLARLRRLLPSAGKP